MDDSKVLNHKEWADLYIYLSPCASLSLYHEADEKNHIRFNFSTNHWKTL